MIAEESNLTTFCTSRFLTMAPTNTPAAGTLDLHQDVQIKLTVKMGARTNLPRNKHGLVLTCKLSQGFNVFMSTIMTFKAEAEFCSLTLHEDKIYFKKSKGSPQAAY